MKVARVLALSIIICGFLTSPGVFAQTPDSSRTAVSRFDALQNYRTGRDLESRNRMEDAETYYREAVRICTEELARNPNNMDSYTVLTWTLQRQKRYNEVISWGERGLRVNAADWRIIETMGEAYFYLNNYEQSMNFMRRYVNALPQGERTSVAYFFTGEIFRYQQKFRHAPPLFIGCQVMPNGGSDSPIRGKMRETV